MHSGVVAGIGLRTRRALTQGTDELLAIGTRAFAAGAPAIIAGAAAASAMDGDHVGVGAVTVARGPSVGTRRGWPRRTVSQSRVATIALTCGTTLALTVG